MAVDPLVDVLAMAGREVLPWTLTYLLHSSLALGAVWLATRWGDLPVTSEAVLWKVALLGSILAAAVQVWAGVPSAGGTLQVELPGSSRGDRAGAVVAPETRSTIRSSGSRRAKEVGDGPGGDVSRTGRTRAAGSPGPSRSPLSGGFPWTACLLPLWALITGALLARILFTHRRFHRAVRDRSSIHAPHLQGTLEELTERAGVRREVRLTCSETLPAPALLGRREICLPKRLLSDLDRRSQNSALAHEVGHVVHGDPRWSLIMSLTTAFLFFQPLNWIAARRIRQTAEFLADDWAVRQGASGLDLARCLSEVASWSVSAAVSRGPGTSAILEREGALVVRTRRLLHPDRTMFHPSRGASSIGGVTLLAVLVATIPSIQVDVQGPTGGSADVARSPHARGRDDNGERAGSMTDGAQHPEVTKAEGSRPEAPEAVLRKGTDPERLRRAGRVLSEEDPVRAVRVFLEIIKGRPGTSARTVAIRGLRGLSDAIALPALDSVARRHPDPAVREEAGEWAKAKRDRKP